MEKNTKNPTENIYQYDAQLALSFQADCEQLLHDFTTQQRFEFPHFAQLWTERNFTAIFEKQPFMLTIHTFVKNCFFVAKKFLFAMDFYKQTGALYLLYSLYYKQPIKNWVKIRLTQTEADKLSQLVQIHKLSEIYHPLYIFHKLNSDGAFQLCAVVQPLGLEAKFFRRYDLSNEEIYKRSPYECPFLKFTKLTNQDPALEQLENTDRKYQELMAEYKQKTQALATFPECDLKNKFKQACEEVFNIPETEAETAGKGKKRKRAIIKNAMANESAVYRAEKAVMDFNLSFDTDPDDLK